MKRSWEAKSVICVKAIRPLFILNGLYKERTELFSNQRRLENGPNIDLSSVSKNYFIKQRNASDPTGKIYIGKDSYGSHRYFGCPDINIINADFENLPKEIRLDYTVRKQILWESENASEKELSEKEVELIRQFQSNDPKIGYNKWPKYKAPNN